MKIFNTEKLDGLQEKITASASMAMTCQIVDNLDFKGDEKVVASLPSNPDQKDLYYLNAILVSTGWNKNDDVFTADALWESKGTPVDKQLNMMHDDNEIIGHMTGSVVIDFDGNIITEKTDEFDIAISAVIYRFRSDDDVRESVATLIDEIEENKWAVSMECLFNGFDYAVIKSDGSHHILERDESTAFLTKHLRAYGGSGKYEDYRIARVLKDITFSGIGIVDNPAGPRSEILKRNTNPFLDVTPITVASLKPTDNIVNPNEEKNMTIEQLQAQIESLKAELAEAKEVADKAKAEAIAQKEAELTAAADQAKADVAVKDEIITSLKADIDELTAAKDKMTDDLKKKNEELESEKNKARLAERRSQLVEAGVKDGDLDVKLEKFGSASDEMFASVVELLKETASKATVETEPADPEDESTEAEEDVEVEPETSEAAANVVEEDDSKDKLRKALADFATAALK